MTFSPDGKLLASGGKDGIRFWNVVEGKELRHIPGQQAAWAPFAFSPDGQLLASVGDDHTIRLWEVGTGKELRRWHSTHLAGSVTLIFAPDGKSLASAGRVSQNQSQVQVWATATGNELLRFGGLDALSLSLTFSPSGRILAAGMYMSKPSSAEIYLWDVQSGEEIRRIRSPQESIHSVAFTPDAQTLVSGGGESSILLWDLTGQVRDGKLLPAALTAKELEKLWVALGGDAAQADRVIWMLARAPQETLPLLKTRLQPVAPADAEKVAKHVADLDSPRFAERDKAVKALQEMGEAAEGAMRKVMDGNPSLEVRRRLERILDHDKQTKEKEVIRRLRAIETVEHIGTTAARQLLEALAKTSPNPRLTQAAAAALQRLAKQIPETRFPTP
jgi:dipeptidyl aminopeptidase/acylaminoacyl peptidase